MRSLTKIILVHVAALLLCSTSHAKDFTFTFHYPYDTQMNKFEVKMEGKDWKEAYERATQKCVSHYLDMVRLNEDTKLDIIDACVNPR